MHLAEWLDGTTVNRARQCSRIVCVTLPFLTIPGIIEQIFPSSRIVYMSLIPRRGVSSPRLIPASDIRQQIPLLSLHLGLVQAYWSIHDGWKPWRFLEDDFSTLRQYGFRFTDGYMTQYVETIESAASQFAELVEQHAIESRANAIAVYGRGHWTMNAAAVVAAKLDLPLYVVERGILPSSYVVDETVPFTAPESRFRSSWKEFYEVEDWDRQDFIGLTESRWRLYSRLLTNKAPATPAHRQPSGILVGQCLFDYNCLAAPFGSPKEFIEYVVGQDPNVLENECLVYRPHPLSPEEYPSGRLDTQYGPVRVDLSDPWNILRLKPTIYTWNSTLGLEGSLMFDASVKALDPECHYSWIDSCSKEDKHRYIIYLNEVSTFWKDTTS